MTSKNYKNTKIYKIWSLLGDDIYIGSTTKEYLSQRMTAHRYTYNKYKKTNKEFITSFLLFDKYGIENCSIELLEAKECSCLDEVRQLEGSYIRKLKCINKNIAGRTIEERRQYQNNRNKIIRQLKKEQKITNLD